MNLSEPTNTSIPVTPMQAGMLVVSRDAQHSVAYLQQLIGDFEERLDPGRFDEAWDRLATRHEVLRTRFRFDAESGWMQEIRDDTTATIERKDWRAWNSEDQEKKFREFLQIDRERGFNFDNEYPRRLSIFRLSDQHERLVWSFHHALLDGWSHTSILGELLTIYDNLREDTQSSDSSMKSSRYSDYLAWLKNWDSEKSCHYWKESLTDAVLFDAEFGGRSKEIFDASTGTLTTNIRLSERISTNLYKMNSQHDLTLNTIALGAWALLVGCYTGEEEVVVGTVRSCRRSLHEPLRQVAGLVINTVPFRVRLSRDLAVTDWLSKIRSQWIELRPYELTPIHRIRKWCDWPAVKPLFNSIYVYDHQTIDASLSKDRGPGWRRRFKLINGRTEAPVSVAVFGGRRLEVVIQVDTELFSPEEADLLGERYRSLLAQLVWHPNRRIGDIERLTAQESQRLLKFNTHPDIQDDSRSLIEIFRQQVQSNPSQPALVGEDCGLSYKQLLDASSNLGELLTSDELNGVVGILLGAEPGFVVAIFAAMNQGTGFIPMDPEYPAERLAFMLKDANIQTIVTDRPRVMQARKLMETSGHQGKIVILKETPPFGSCSCEVISVDGTQPMPTQSSTGLDGLVYIIYTSGTTGKPKGVPITNNNLMPLMQWQKKHFNLSEQTRMVQTLSVSFDFGIQEVLTALLFGGTLFCPPPRIRRDPNGYIDYLTRHSITMVYATPSFMQAVIWNRPQMDSLRVVLLGGEQLSWELVDRLLSCVHKNCVVFNGYGPTEAAINCSMYRIQSDTSPERSGANVPIGTPTGRSRLYVLDRRRRQVPMGVPGELYIGGPGVASGYHNRPELTEQKFVPDSVGPDPSARLYRTGDRVRHFLDGSLEFLGRTDRQVKIRGFRIELEEIESVLSEHDQLKSAAVTVEESLNGDQRIVAYVVAQSVSPSPQAIRRYIRQRLPSYMVPSKVWHIEAMPLTENGKVDRRRLCPPKREQDRSSSDIIATSVEELDRAAFDEWFYKPVWMPSPRGVEVRQTMSKQDRWLIFCDDSKLSVQLVTRIKERGVSVVTVMAGHADFGSKADIWTINPVQPEDYEKLFAALKDSCKLPAAIVYLWSLRSHKRSTITGSDGGFERLLYLLQAIGKLYRTREMSLAVVTSNAQSIIDGDLLHPRSALLLGLCRVISFEFPMVQWTSIDLDLRRPLRPELVHKLIDDISSRDLNYKVIGYRKRQRYTLQFKKLTALSASSNRIVPGGTYLITGGLGAIGRVLAEGLARQTAVNLVLLDTQTVTDKRTQDGELSKSERILEELGSKVMVVGANICERDDVRIAVSKARERFGRIRGVIHAAGFVSPTVIRKLTADKAAQVLRPKVEGTEILADALASDKPDFVLLCSSIDAIRGSFSQADYCAANAFLDAFAHRMNQRGQRYISVNWDVWRDEGMAARVKVSPALQEARRKELQLGISTQEGIRALFAALAFDEPQVIISTTDLDLRIDRYGLTLDIAAAGIQDGEISEGDSVAGPMEQIVLEAIINVLDDESITSQDNFFERGGDSLSGMRIIARLETEFGVRLPLSSLFEAPTPIEIVALLIDSLVSADP